VLSNYYRRAYCVSVHVCVPQLGCTLFVLVLSAISAVSRCTLFVLILSVISALSLSLLLPHDSQFYLLRSDVLPLHGTGYHACIPLMRDGENFRGWLSNCEIREAFLPQKFPAIQ
jgi:hypothetical protein